MSICTHLFNLLLTLCLFRNVWSSCVFQDGMYDLSSLDRSSPWPVPGTLINGTMYHYEISLCRPLKYTSINQRECNNSSICLISKNNSVSFGLPLENTTDYAIASNFGNGFHLYVHTKNSCTQGKYRSSIDFSCGPNLGSPKLLMQTACQVNFLWRTSAACAVKPKRPQVPCYVLDDEGNKRDLSPLIKDGGHYVMTSNPAVSFLINVCADLSFSGLNVTCPANSSACRINGDEAFSFGSLYEGPKYTREGLLLMYNTPDSSPLPPDCKLRPKTTILFKCPYRGFIHPPKVISDSNCQYEIEWETEYACPENILKGDFKTCQFTRDSHGVEIDLSSLRNKVYNISASNSTYYALSVCGGLENITCNGQHWKSTSVCLFNTSSDASQKIGSTESSEFVYADHEVILRYMKGESCNEMTQTSVINFICDENATNNGDGQPTFVESHDCNHIFEFRTKHACVKHPLDTPCYVTYDKKTINLQKLLITNDGEPAWEAIDHRNVKAMNNSEYFLNVCGQVSKLGNLSKCGEGSSACVKIDKDNYLNLGNFSSPPEYDYVSNSVRLHYSGGSSCKNGKFWQSTIEFICKPGHINSSPVLTRIDENECHYKFEWQTAEACPIGLIEGSNCKVYDSNLGVNYDLTPLKSKVYKIDSDKYEFYIGVCEPVRESPCSSGGNVGVCQVDKSNKSSLKIGEPTSSLSYMDGVVNLTYLSGEHYSDQNHTERMTIIVFICDYNAGNGNPNFVEEINFAYVFHWYTDLVCPPSVSAQCIVHDPISHLIYDLSGLSMAKKNWMTIINESGKERQIYVNVCRSLTLPSSCDSTAAACIVEHDKSGNEIAVISNLGRALNPPVIKNPGHLTLTYINGDPCVAFGENLTYTTVIEFLCAEDKMSQTGFRFLSKIGACEYSFLWATKAACPTGNLMSTDSCQLTDRESGFTFDLMPLNQNKPFTVQSPSGSSFQLNICGKVEGGCFDSDGHKQPKNISVCEVDSNGKLISNIATSDSYNLTYSSGRDLTLTYKSSDENLKDVVVIKFPCYNSSIEESPKFLGHEDGQYFFELKTHLTCIPEPFDCNVIDKFGNEYDFSPLAKYSDGNWEVSDTREGYKDQKYHINFCRPLNKVTSYKCPAGASSACQTSILKRDSIGNNLGSQMEEPKVSDKGTVVIRYTNGSLCHNGLSASSTTIYLYCYQKEGELTFLGETEECEYVFSLDTPAACPLQSSQGSNCTVKEPSFGYIFDLNPLKSKNNNYNITVGEYNYAFNVCDKLNGFTDKCTNSSACQLKSKDPDFSKSLGLPSDKLAYRKGVITLQYISGTGNCHKKYNRTTKITFTCHHAHEDKDGPIYVGEEEDCTYLFEWPTVRACPPFDVIECSVIDKDGMFYDLSRLSLPNQNYYTSDPNSDKVTYVINVCRSVVHTPNSLCPYTSAACLVNSSSKADPINLGRVSQAPYFQDGKLKIKYTSGDPCNEEGGKSARFMETVIEFSCDPALIDSEPQFIGRDSCTYFFDWATAYACPSKSSKIVGDCSVNDPVTGHVFNLSSLGANGFFKVKQDDYLYYLNICGNDSSSPCGNNTGMCQEETSGVNHWSGGKPNGNLTYSNGIIYLNYTKGDYCHNNKFQRSTLIEFHCDPDNGIGEPEFLYESHDCSYAFSWKTELACQELMHCAIRNLSLHYDLTSLAESYYTATSFVVNDEASYYVRVCSSLESIPGASCPLDAAICRVSKDPKTLLTVSESLGKVEHPPFIDFEGQATAIYTNGSKCLKNPNFQNRARIIFLCDSNAGVGEPVLLSVDEECLYLFEWRTSIMCPEKPEVPSEVTSCTYTDNSRGIHFDLTPLQKKGTRPYYEIYENPNSVLQLNICSTPHASNVSKCADAGVCVQSENTYYNYGKASSQKFTYEGRRLRLTFAEGDDCPSGRNGKRTSEILFVCDPSAGLGRPVLRRRYTCLAVFMWNTALVCQDIQHQCAFDINENHFDFNLLSSLTHNWVSSDAKNNTYWINLCRGVRPSADTMGCPPTAAVCMEDQKGNHMSLGMVQTVKAKPINATDLLLTFDNGDSKACSSINSASSMTAVTRLFMKCGNSLGQPRMFSGPDNKCFYDFIWESSLACADKAEEVLMEKDGIIKDKRLDFSFDIKDILNKTFTVVSNSTNEQYVYKINLSGGVAKNTSDPRSTCAKAAVCQTKPPGPFERDIGSFDTRTFIVRGSELHLVFKSMGRACGKNPSKVVTTLISMQCMSAAGEGSPKFIYESGNCDYVFEWPTIVVCPEHYKKQEPKTDPFKEDPPTSHKAEIAVGVIFSLLAAMVILYIVVKPERRAIISSRFRSAFGRVSLPYFRYKRCEGERLVLVDASQTLYDDDEMLRC